MRARDTWYAMTVGTGARGAIVDARGEEFFDKRSLFVLDTGNFSSIIYIWYEGGELRPALVRLRSLDLALSRRSRS
jgi:hypothetical protein